MNVLRFGMAAMEFACDMSQVASVLTWKEAQGVEQIDLGELLGLGPSKGHVALLRMARQLPLGLCIGEPRGVRPIAPKDVIFLPQWVHPLLYEHLAPVVLKSQEPDVLIWLLSLSSLLKGHRR